MPTVTQKPRIVNWSEDNMYFVIESDRFAGAEAPFTPTHANLSCYVEVWEMNRQTGDQQILVALDVPYDPYTKSAVVDIRGLKEFSVHLPDLNSTHGTADKAFGLLFIKYADKFGAPAVPDVLSQLPEVGAWPFQAIYGSTRIPLKDDTHIGIPLHRFVTSDGIIHNRFKETTEVQKEWIYFYLGFTRDVKIVTRIFYDDDTSEIAEQTERFSGINVHWIDSSYQTRVGHRSKKVFTYTVDLIVYDSADDIDVLIATVSYKVVPCIQYERYLAYSNGKGAIETVRMTGEFDADFRATREKYSRPQFGDVDRAVGTIGSYNHTGQMVYNFNSGYMSNHEVFHLRQLLLSDAWMIDSVKNKFIAISPITNDIKKVQQSGLDKKDLYYLEISYEDSIYTNTAVPPVL